MLCAFKSFIKYCTHVVKTWEPVRKGEMSNKNWKKVRWVLFKGIPETQEVNKCKVWMNVSPSVQIRTEKCIPVLRIVYTKKNSILVQNKIQKPIKYFEKPFKI
jgi:hypothetical protein